ncbi:MAG: methyltransferase [Sphingobacteriales bacterium]|nr:MAG: methyltransferase [Sphingobacteriales bacterium]
MSSITEENRLKVNGLLDPKKKSIFGQFYTPLPVCQFMASLFNTIQGDVRLLDPGCGIGSLSAAFADNLIQQKNVSSFEIDMYDIEPIVEPFVRQTLTACEYETGIRGIKFKSQFNLKDFILHSSSLLSSHKIEQPYTHVIMNPPYKKLNSTSDHRMALRRVGIETVNLYSGFIALATKLLAPNGQMVAIIPRSFCNGPYYYHFRDLLLKETSIRQIHIFDHRENTFDDVLQENVIIYCEKSNQEKKVKITSSPSADFHYDIESQEFVASDMTVREVDMDSVVNPNDQQKFIHIAASEREQIVVNSLSSFKSSLKDLDIEVSTGAVVDFRVADFLSHEFKDNAVPLLYPVHLGNEVTWPKEGRKPDWIICNSHTLSSLWQNKGSYVIVKRFSSKEERKRIVATFYDSKLPFDLIGFENKLNVFHHNKRGLDETLAKGLFGYLNSTLLDEYYRQFGGHTQVNATDLRALPYPDLNTLKRIGEKIINLSLTHKEIDYIVSREIFAMTGKRISDITLQIQEKIENAVSILKQLELPKAQINERSALTLLALSQHLPTGNWHDIQCPMLGVTPIMEWCKVYYHKQYAPNTREAFRRQTLHQFVSAGILVYNPDNPNRPINSPKACYQLTSEAFNLLKSFNTRDWDLNLKRFLEQQPSLVKRYAMERDVEHVVIEQNNEIIGRLSPGQHSKLIKDIILDFTKNFAPSSQVLYIGDTANKGIDQAKDELMKLGVRAEDHGKMPDVILYDSRQNWLYLIEAVTSHGPVDGKRYDELQKLFGMSTAGLVYVTAFPDKKTMTKYLADISWETEVWIADNPTHMIHFNGDRFLDHDNFT